MTLRVLLAFSNDEIVLLFAGLNKTAIRIFLRNHTRQSNISEYKYIRLSGADDSKEVRFEYSEKYFRAEGK